MAGEDEQHQLVADVVVRKWLARMRIGRGEQCTHQRSVAVRVSSHRGENLGGQLMQSRIGPAGALLARGGHPLRQIHRPQRTVGDPRERGAQCRPDGVGPGIEVQPEHRAAKRPQRECAALGVQVDCHVVAPTVDQRLRRRRHMTGVARNALFGEHRLQRAAPRQPFVMRQVQQVAAHQPTHLDRARHPASVGDLVGAAQHVPRALRRGDQHRGRKKPFGPEHHTGDGATGVKELLVPVDKRPQCPELVPVAQRILRRQRQFGDINRFRRLKHGSSPFWKTSHEQHVAAVRWFRPSGRADADQ